MKTALRLSLLSFAISATTAIGGSTISGAIDVGGQFGLGGTSLVSNETSTSEVVFAGVEKLNSRAIEYKLAAAVDPLTGTSSFFSRAANLTVSGPEGRLTIGLANTVSSAPLNTAGLGTNGIGSITVDVFPLGSNARTLIRAPQMVSYSTPAIGGVVLTGQVGTGFRGAGFVMTKPTFDLLASYTRTDAPVDDYALATMALVMKPKFGKVGFMVNDGRYRNRHQTVVSLGTIVPRGAWEYRAALAYSDMKGSNAAPKGMRGADDTVHASLQVRRYFIPNRAWVYASLSMLDNRGDASRTMGGLPEVAGDFQRGARVGIAYRY
jgi:hypothetical protein